MTKTHFKTKNTLKDAAFFALKCFFANTIEPLIESFGVMSSHHEKVIRNMTFNCILDTLFVMSSHHEKVIRNMNINTSFFV